MKKIYYLLIAITIGFFACSDDEGSKTDPTISFMTTTGYTSADVELAEGDSIFIGIEAKYNGSDNLTALSVLVNDQEVDSEVLDDLQIERSWKIKKSAAPSEEWTFEVTDAGGRTASVSITLTLVYGDIITNNSVILGAQNNASLGSFYSTSEDQVFLQGAAYTNQELIDIVYYYDEADLNTLASPGANIADDVFTGTSGLVNWTTLNETRYLQTNLTEAQFDAVANDSIFNYVYNSDDAKRKAKNLAVGDIYSFRTESGRLGLIKVVAVNGEATGDIEIAIKMQE